MIRNFLRNLNKNEEFLKFANDHNAPLEYLQVNKKSVLRGVAIGAFVALIIMPMQSLAVLLFMPSMKFNIPIAFAMTWLSNPFTTPFILFIEYKIGSFMLQIETTSVEITVEWFAKNIENILFPIYIGTIFCSTVFAFTSYYLVNFFWKR